MAKRKRTGRREVVIGGLGRGVPAVRFKRYRTPQALGVAFFRPMGSHPRHIDQWPDMLKGMEDMKCWAFCATRDKPPVIHYWAAEDISPMHLAYVLGHEVGHISGRKLKSRRNAWREEVRADEYGASAMLALKEVLKRRKS